MQLTYSPFFASPRSSLHRARGYILLVLMLFVSLLSIAFMVTVEKIDFEIKRDREEELIHRGVQYSRAIRRFVKKFGRYPGSLEELESTNNIRFLRKRYKDPITGAEFKLLHMQDLQLPGGGPGVSAAAIAGQQQQSGTAASSVPGTELAGQGPGQTSNDASNEATKSDSAIAGELGPTANDDEKKEYVSQIRSEQQQEKIAEQADVATSGGPAIVGVMSRSKMKAIREFNKQDHYDQWKFIYSPGVDYQGLISTPYQPLPQGISMGQSENTAAISTPANASQ
jgi:type II secretory pathway pseudopilin PulG